MATETKIIQLNRNNSSVPWGFRLQGGTDFTTPLSIQLVNPGSVAEICGLQAGDAVLSINDRPSDELEHEAAKRVILLCGDQVVLKIQRGGVKIWRPKVTPISQLRPGELNKIPHDGADHPYVQKTSLAADKQESLNIGSSHNRSARPFAGFGSGAPQQQQQQQAYNPQQQQDKAIVHNPYNTPMGLYSASNIANTYSTQAQYLTGNMAGLSVHDDEIASAMKADKTETIEPPKPVPDRGPSPTFLAVHDEKPPPERVSAPYMDQKEGEEIQYQGYSNPNKQSRSFRLLEGELNAKDGGSAPHEPPQAPPSRVVGTRSVQAPVAKPPSERPQQQHMTCKGCGMLVAGVFVKIKGDPFHPECFKCASCGKNLKQQGYFQISGQLYCEVHARQMAQPPGDDMVSVPVYR